MSAKRKIHGEAAEDSTVALSKRREKKKRQM